MRGGCKAYPPPTHPLFFSRKLSENIWPSPIGRQPGIARDEGLSRFSYPVSSAYKCKILKFGFSYWIMSPTVGLTFPVSYTFFIQNNIMAEFQWKVWKHKLFYTKCLWISNFFLIFTFIGSSVIYLSLSKIPIWTHQRQFGLIRYKISTKPNLIT